MLDNPRLARIAYQRGVTMGGDLPGKGEDPPAFIVWAAADPSGTALQRVQIIKGYLENGAHQERIYDVACANNLQPDPSTGLCPDNGAAVNLSDCSTTGSGASELKALWHDPDFDPGQEAFYYVRVLENPSCRWSTWDAIRAGEEPRSDLPKTIQERAWSSPIWFRPDTAPQAHATLTVPAQGAEDMASGDGKASEKP